MAIELLNLLRERFPPFQGNEMVTVYGAHERLHVSGIDQQLYDAVRKGHPTPLDNHGVVEKIAKTIFDVPFKYETKGTVNDSIFFMEEIDERFALDDEQNKYLNNWKNHHITVELPKVHPVITFDLANRGSGYLLSKQRQKCYEFMLAMYDLFYERARNDEA